jgi:hypothetical protein
MAFLGLFLCVLAGASDFPMDPVDDATYAAPDSMPGVKAPRGKHDVRLEDRTVSTARTDRDAPLWTFGREELSSGKTLPELLSQIPGVEVRSSGGVGGYAQVQLRLCPPSQVRVTLDGVPLGGGDGSTVDMGSIAVDGLERVEVLQGDGAGGGERPEIRLVSRRGFGKFGASAGVGSFGERSGSLWWGDSSGRWSLAGWGLRADNDWPVRWDRGTPYNAADDTTLRLQGNDYEDAGLAFSWRPTQEISADLRGDASDKGVGGLYVGGHEARYVRQSMQMAIASQGSERWDLPWEISGRLHRSHWSDTGSSVDYRSNRDAKELGWAASAGAGLAGRSEGTWDPWLHATLGIEQSDWSTQTPGRVFLTPGASRWTGSLEGGWKGQDPSGRVGGLFQLTGTVARDDRDFGTAAMRGDLVAANDSAWERFGWEAKLRAWTRGGDGLWQTWIGGSGSERLPDFYELYGDNGLTFQNIALRPERSWSAELGARLAGNGWSVGAVPWVALYEDPIRKEMIGTSPASRYSNDSGYLALGSDLDASARGRWGSCRAQGTLVRTSIRSPYAAVRGNEMEKTPRWKASFVAETPAWKGLTLEYDFEAQGEAWTTTLNREKEPGRRLHDLRIGWRRDWLVLRASCENLLDEQFADWTNAPLSGRSWHLRVDIDFNRLQRKEHQ